MKNTNFKLDFIGIGAAKSGTTWLADRLDAHPHICVSEPKEVNYFNYKNTVSDIYLHRQKEERLLNPNKNKPIEWYENHFRHCSGAKVMGEFSTVYLYDKVAPEAIKERFPDVKLIAILRNPIDRLYSDYWMFKSSFRFEDRSLEKAIKEGPQYIERGMYHKQIAHYLKYFDREQLLVMFHDDIKTDPHGTIKQAYSFLGVDNTFVPKKLRDRSNYAKEGVFRGAVNYMDIIVRKMVQFKLGFFVRFLKKVKFNKFLLRLISKKISYPPMNPETREYLRGVFTDDIKKLEQLTGRDLSGWR